MDIATAVNYDQANLPDKLPTLETTKCTLTQEPNEKPKLRAFI
jgi:hypothetical protein